MRRMLAALAVVILAAPASYASGTPGLLLSKYMEEGVAQSFRVGGDWYPYPAYSDREGWDGLLTGEARDFFARRAEKYLGYEWKHIPASTFLALDITGDKQAMRRIEAANREAFIALMMGELAEGRGRFMQDLADGFWFYGTSYHWSHSNQTKGRLPRYEDERVALGNVRMAATIPVAWHFFHEELDRMDPAISEAVRAAVKRIILDPALDEAHPDSPVWLGATNRFTNNWNPWCNHGVLLAFLLMEQDQQRLDRAILQSVSHVDRYIEAYSRDGACVEGGEYWGQSVARFREYLQLLRDASQGRFDVLPDELFGRMCEYKSRIYVGMDASGRGFQVNFGDGSAVETPSPMLIWCTGAFMGSEELCDLALAQCARPLTQDFAYPDLSSDEGYRQLDYVRCYTDVCKAIDALNGELSSGRPFAPVLASLRARVPSYTWYPALQQAFCRTSDGWFLGAKAGHNGEAHGHNDVGSFVLYVDGAPVLVDPGVGTYVKDTFGEGRYTIWTMVSDWHNCPSPNGVGQANGARYAASSSDFKAGRHACVMTSEIHGAYSQEASCLSWRRSLTLADSPRGSRLEIDDRYALSGRHGRDDVHFITPGAVSHVRDGLLSITTEGVTVLLEYPASTLTPFVEERTIDDAHLVPVWGDRLYCIHLLSSPDAPLTGRYKVTLTRKRQVD